MVGSQPLTRASPPYSDYDYQQPYRYDRYNAPNPIDHTSEAYSTSKSHPNAYSSYGTKPVHDINYNASSGYNSRRLYGDHSQYESSSSPWSGQKAYSSEGHHRESKGQAVKTFDTTKLVDLEEPQTRHSRGSRGTQAPASEASYQKPERMRLTVSEEGADGEKEQEQRIRRGSDSSSKRLCSAIMLIFIVLVTIFIIVASVILYFNCKLFICEYIYLNCFSNQLKFKT